MGSKEIKKLLLDSKQAIMKKDFDVALKNCKAVLFADKQNYNAFVFLGAIFQETQEPEKSLSAFRRAIEISPDLPLAWQGLRSFYEKHKQGQHTEDLVLVYKKLADLFTEDKMKKAEVLLSLAIFYRDKMNDLTKGVDGIMKAVELLPDEPSSLQVTCWVTVVAWLSTERHLEDKFMNILSDGMRKVCRFKADGVFHELAPEVINGYLSLILKASHYELVVEEARLLERFFPTVSLTKWYLLAYISCCIDNCSLYTHNIDALIQSVGSNDECLAYAHIAKGARHYIANEWNDAKSELLFGLKIIMGRLWQGWILACRVFERLHDGSHLQHSAREGLKVIELEGGCNYASRKAEFQLGMAKGILLRHSIEQLDSALLILDEAIENNTFKMEALFCQGMVHLKMKNWDKVREVISLLESCEEESHFLPALQGCLHSRLDEHQLAITKFTIALEIRPFDAFLCQEMGLAHWNAKEFPAAYSCFLQVAKADPYNSITFLMIGHYYRDVVDDKRKALRSYRQAFNLDGTDKEIGIALSDCYRAVGDGAANLEFLSAVAIGAPGGQCGWAWLRLGILHLNRDYPELAITCLQAALRVNPNNGECWECLAEAYLLRGSHASAIKAFNKALELDPLLLYCKYQIANIKLKLGFFKEAIDSFEKIVDVMPSYVPALKGLGEAYLFQARHHLDRGLSSEAVECCEKALISLASAVVVRPDFSCLWKLVGDAIVAVTSKVRDTVAKVPSSLLATDRARDAGEFVSLNSKDLLNLAVRCYSSSVRLSRYNSNLWHDVAVANHLLSLVSLDSLEERRSCINKALAALKRAIILKPSQSSHWSALGVVTCSDEIKNYSLAQHAFIQAVKTEPNNVVAWSNLGTLYLIHGNIQLANQAFVKAQSVEPSYVNCWIGQALCAENIGHHDTLDLFRHCTSLRYHPESSLGYASWVCTTVLDPAILHTESYRYNIEELAAIPAAADCISHYTNTVKNDPYAYNISGLLLERQGLNGESKKAFERAKELLSLKDGGQEFQSQLASFVHCNHARVLRLLGFYEEAASEAAAVEIPDFYNTYCKAAAFYQAGRMEDSDQAYSEAFQTLAKTDEEKSHLTMAMASVIFKLQGSDAAKTPLYECFQFRPPCVQGLLALAAVGLLESDGDLAVAAIHELEQAEPDLRFTAKMNHVRSLLLLAQGRQLDARNVFSKAVHQWPADWHQWKELGIHLMANYEGHKDSKRMAVRCLAAGLTLWTAPCIEILQLFCVCLISANRLNEGLMAAKKLVHLFPDEPCNWDMFALLKNAVQKK